MNKLTLLVMVLFAFSANTFSKVSNELPKDFVVSSFQIANFEALNLDSKVYSQVTFKENDCETGGYSFFSPFHLDANLAYATYSTKVEEDEVFISIKKGEDVLDYNIVTIELSEDNTEASINIKRENFIFKSILNGENLSKEGILEMFNPTSDQYLIQQEACPVCVVVIAVIVADTVSDMCKNAQEQYRNCSGTLEVGACSCSCTPK